MVAHGGDVTGIGALGGVHIAEENAGANGDVVGISTVADSMQGNCDPLYISYTGKAHSHGAGAGSAHTGDASGAGGDFSALNTEGGIDGNSEWKGENDLGEIAAATLNT
jgi:hypothetical protein